MKFVIEKNEPEREITVSLIEASDGVVVVVDGLYIFKFHNDGRTTKYNDIPITIGLDVDDLGIVRTRVE